MRHWSSLEYWINYYNTEGSMEDTFLPNKQMDESTIPFDIEPYETPQVDEVFNVRDFFKENGMACYGLRTTAYRHRDGDDTINVGITLSTGFGPSTSIEVHLYRDKETGEWEGMEDFDRLQMFVSTLNELVMRTARAMLDPYPND